VTAHKRRRDESESEYSEGERDYDHREEDDERVEWAESKDQIRELTAHDVNKIKFGRSLLAKFCHHPNFEEAVVGSFVRVNVGFNRDKQTYVYRVCRVKSLVNAKPYKFLNRTVDQSLLVANGPSERTIEMGICSDNYVTDEEFKWWKDYMESADLALPSVRRIQKKYDELLALQQRVLSPEEVEEMIKKRQGLSGNTGGMGADVVVSKSMLQEKRAIALEKNDFVALERIDFEIEQIDRAMNKNKRKSELDKLAKVNERNRRRNLDEIRRAEIRAQEMRRKALKEPNAASVADPFSRHRTQPRLFYESNSKSATPVPEGKTEEPQMEIGVEPVSSVTAKKTAAMDDMIASLDIDVEIEI
jgi:RNA polymerase-associated protein RTF1